MARPVSHSLPVLPVGAGMRMCLMLPCLKGQQPAHPMLVTAAMVGAPAGGVAAGRGVAGGCGGCGGRHGGEWEHPGCGVLCGGGGWDGLVLRGTGVRGGEKGASGFPEGVKACIHAVWGSVRWASVSMVVAHTAAGVRQAHRSEARELWRRDSQLSSQLTAPTGAGRHPTRPGSGPPHHASP